jgi:transcriptional regulator with XRE-family HTH domain
VSPSPERVSGDAVGFAVRPYESVGMGDGDMVDATVTTELRLARTEIVSGHGWLRAVLGRLTERLCEVFPIIDMSGRMTKMRNMPASSPYTSPEQQADLEHLGARLRERRKALGVTVVACAEAAGVSRVTMHRIEAGNPSVTIGAYVNVAAALGLHLVVPILDAPAAEPATITVGDYPGLRTLAWQTDAGTTITETEALNLYERGWRHLNQETLTDHEKAFIQHLADTYSNGRLLV